MTKKLVNNTIEHPPSAEIIEKVIMSGDLSGLTPEQRLAYYKSVCETLHLNPLTKPFDYIVLDGKLTLYATKDCAAQLRKRHRITIAITSREKEESVYVVTAKASLRTVSSVEPREDESIGVVSIINKEGAQIKGTALANAIMKAETKAKRRVTLSVCGLGMLDEGELESEGNDFDQRTSNEIIERNMRQATANATEVMPSGGTVTAHKDGSFTATMPKSEVNEYGPLVVTQDNYKERISHVGKASGRIVGRKVGEMERPVIEWMYNKWRDSLGPTATEDDMRLKKAIEFAYKDLSGAAVNPPETSQAQSKGETATVAPTQLDIGAKQAAMNDLRERIDNLILTEEQAVSYIVKYSVGEHDWKMLDDLPDAMLLYLCTPNGWQTFKDQYEKEAKPQVVEKPVKKRTRKK